MNVLCPCPTNRKPIAYFFFSILVVLTFSLIAVAASTTLPAAFFRQPYSNALQSSFGVAPYTYTLISGSLPQGITLDQTGNLSGSATTAGAFTFQIQATDSSTTSKTLTTNYSLAVSIGLDPYGGLTALPSPNGASGYFRVEKVGGRWNLVSPQGNTFWLTSVYVANESYIKANFLQNRYGGNAELWATHRNNRLLSWGFNTLGEYTAQRGLPVGTWGTNPPNQVKLPFIIIFNTLIDVSISPDRIGLPEQVKNIMAGVPTTTYNGKGRILVDVFDPKFQQGYQGELAYQKRAITGGFANVPWVVGITTDDADYLFGMRSSGTNIVAKYPNSAYLVATALFQYSPSQNPKWVAYKDPKLYSKYAWIDYLQQKYGTIQNLNAAWGSNYTTFGDRGWFGIGTGVLDEDGRHTAWMGSDPYNLSNANPNVKTDLNAFLYKFAYQYASVAVNTIRSYDPNHLIFGPTSLNSWGGETRPEVLQAMADAGLNALTVNYDPLTGDMSGNSATYDLTGLPELVWYAVSANADSALYAQAPVFHAPDFPNQAIRAQHYDSDLNNFFNAKGATGDHFMLGIDWWELTDGNASEATNWGLMTIQDNAYNGNEDIRNAGKDQWGFPTGGEVRNFGNFIDPATQTNSGILQQLITEQQQVRQ